LGPAQVKAAYGFPTAATAGAGRTVAIVAPFDAPTIEHDLNAFATKYDLPSCTTANGCFRKVDAKGGKSYPAKDKLWALEISLDVEWAHAIAPGAKILLVEARSDTLSDVVTAEDYATAHAAYVSNSLGLTEFAGETGYDGHFRRAGVSIFAASGDDGAAPGPGYPASVPTVVAVGGTTLSGLGQPTFAETGWRGSGGGCSVYERAGDAQRASPGYAAVNCAGMRAGPDVSLVADPHSGVAVYDSYRTSAGWTVVGGTSAAAPMWAARAAVSGLVIDAATLYSATSPITFRDITAGSNGLPALPGYDLVTGLGSWTGSTP
ncbi:MAG TPA: S53 family peptidase, partial [Acidimicrobiia bacterium]|nr:S53 family peptidase [Acidimicrobiia bacterium]